MTGREVADGTRTRDHRDHNQEQALRYLSWHVVWALIGHRSRPIGQRAPLLDDSRSMAREPLITREVLERTALRRATGLTPRELER